jgi:uncharacterized protein (TIGR02270 family)
MIEVILRQHIEEAAILHAARTRLSSAPHVKLRHLGRFDDRLEAHLDGLLISGESSWPLHETELERARVGEIFVAAVRAIEDGRIDRLDRLFALIRARPGIEAGLFSAFGWMEAEKLRGWVVGLLNSDDSSRRLAAVTACAMHRVDADLISARRFDDRDPAVRARAWRTAGELGMHQLVSTAAVAMVAEEPACQFWAAWSAVLMGDRRRALEKLGELAGSPGPFRARALRLAIQAMGVGRAHALLQSLTHDAVTIQKRIRGAGFAGDPAYVPWLIGLMADDPLARLAGESFSLITGLDLAWLDLERKPPENFESGPNDDPNDPNVEMDEDDGLPWPDQAKIQAWWNENSQRFQPGVRYFMGLPLNPEHCLRVLKEGFQRQRILAAHYLCLLKPGTVLFNTSAPAWRQQRLLAEMS